MSIVLHDLSPHSESGWNRLLGVPSAGQRGSVASSSEDRGRHAEFTVSLRTARPQTYQCCDENARETFSGGVLPAGTMIWLRPGTLISKEPRVNAYLEGIGLVTMERCWPAQFVPGTRRGNRGR